MTTDGVSDEAQDTVPPPEYLGENWSWAILLTLAQFAPLLAFGFVATSRSGSLLDHAVASLVALLAGVMVFMRTRELDDGGTRAKRENYRNWRRVRAIGVAVTFAIAFTPLGAWLASPWQSPSLLVGIGWGLGVAAATGVGWLFHPGDQVLSAYGSPAGLPADLLVAPLWLIRALTAHGLLPLLLGIATASRELVVIAFFMTSTEYLLSMRTTVVVSRTTFWDLVRGRQPY